MFFILLEQRNDKLFCGTWKHWAHLKTNETGFKENQMYAVFL